MRSALMIVAAALCTTLAQGVCAQETGTQQAGPQQCKGCKWHPVVASAALGTVDLYGALDSREDCERLIAQAPAPDPAVPDLTAECVEDSRLDAWYRDHRLDARP